MNSKTIANVFKIVICINFILLCIIPLGSVFGPLDEKDMASEFGWNPDYFYSDELTLILIAPFYLLWFGYLVNKEKLIKQILAILLLAASAFYAFLSFTSVSMLAQDYQPDWGFLILFLFFPMLVVFFILEIRASKITETDIHSDIILDDGNVT